MHSSNRRNALIAGALAALLTFGCGVVGTTVIPIVARVLAVVLDAQQIVGSIDAAAVAYFDQHPDSPYRKAYVEASADAKNALNVVVRTAQGAQALDARAIDAAFDAFRDAYHSLVAVLNSARIMNADGNRLLLAAPGGPANYDTIKVPEPLALTYRVGNAR